MVFDAFPVLLRLALQ